VDGRPYLIADRTIFVAVYFVKQHPVLIYIMAMMRPYPIPRMADPGGRTV